MSYPKFLSSSDFNCLSINQCRWSHNYLDVTNPTIKLSNIYYSWKERKKKKMYSCLSTIKYEWILPKKKKLEWICKKIKNKNILPSFPVKCHVLRGKEFNNNEFNRKVNKI